MLHFLCKFQVTGPWWLPTCSIILCCCSWTSTLRVNDKVTSSCWSCYWILSCTLLKCHLLSNNYVKKIWHIPVSEHIIHWLGCNPLTLHVDHINSEPFLNDVLPQPFSVLPLWYSLFWSLFPAVLCLESANWSPFSSMLPLTFVPDSDLPGISQHLITDSEIGHFNFFHVFQVVPKAVQSFYWPINVEFWNDYLFRTHSYKCSIFLYQSCTNIALGSFKCNGNHSKLWEIILLQQNTNYDTRTYLVISSCWVFQQHYVDKNCINCLFWQKTLLNVKHLPF